ncbi:MAG: hypothetical protein U1E14_09050 [Geminicoccaceae bacterium]
MGRKLVRGVVVRALAEDKVSIVGLLLRQTKSSSRRRSTGTRRSRGSTASSPWCAA